MAGGFFTNSSTPASNTSIGGIGAADGSDAGNADDLFRELAAQGKQFANDISGNLTVGGTGDAVTLTLSSGSPGSYSDGLIAVFAAPGANTVTEPTININSLGNKKLKKYVPGTGESVLAANDIRSGGLYAVKYRSSWASAAGAFQLIDLNHDVLITSDQLAQIGSIIEYAGASAPSKWLLCYGQAINRTTYSALYAVIGTTFGVGDGSTTFNLPDLRGRVVAGKDDMGGSSANRLTNQSGGLDGDTLGATGGAETHTLTTAQMPLHGHPFRTGDNSGSSPDSQGGFAMENGGQQSFPEFTGTVSGTEGEQIGGTGGGTAHNNVQPTIVLNKIIYAGV